MKKLEFLNPALFKIHTNINGYLDEENSLVQISGYYTSNDWINIGFYIKANGNISTTIENGNIITYLVYDLMTKKYSFTNSLDKLNIYKLYFKLYVNNNKFYVSTNSIIPVNTVSSIFDIPYTRIFVGTSFPTNAVDYDSYYDFYAKKLYVYISGNWQEINWKEYIKSDRLYKEGRLRINDSTNGLEIITSNTTWYEIVPTIGAAFTPISYTGYVYYIAPGQTYNGFSSSVAPIIAVNNTQYKGVYFHTYPGEAWFGIFPSGLAIGDGYGIYNGQAAATSGRNFVPILEQANANANWAEFSIQIIKNMMRITGLGQGYSGNYAELTIDFGTFPANGYYLGIWCYEGTPVIVEMVSIKREA